MLSDPGALSCNPVFSELFVDPAILPSRAECVHESVFRGVSLLHRGDSKLALSVWPLMFFIPFSFGVCCPELLSEPEADIASKLLDSLRLPLKSSWGGIFLLEWNFTCALLFMKDPSCQIIGDNLQSVIDIIVIGIRFKLFNLSSRAFSYTTI